MADELMVDGRMRLPSTVNSPAIIPYFPPAWISNSQSPAFGVESLQVWLSKLMVTGARAPVAGSIQ
jgi:hypothetical protein